MYKHCLNCRHCKELKIPHRVGGSWHNAHCELKHTYFLVSRMRALFCLKFKESEE